MNTYKVIESRTSEFPNPITLTKSEKVRCLNYSDPNGDWPGWVLCKTDNYEGWVPHQILEIIDNEAVVVEDYCAIEFDLEVGEILHSEKQLNGWIWCYKESNSLKYAWAPLNCIEIVE